MTDEKDHDPKLRVLDEELDIALLPGEELLVEGDPIRSRLATYLMLSWSLLSSIMIFGIPFLPFIWWAARVFARRHKYWITNNRVIVANGIIGHNVRSVPLERISDVAVRVSWLEKLMGLSSVIVRDMTGEAQAGAALLAVPNPAELQAHILDYVRQVNREPKSEADQKNRGTPYREVKPMGQEDKMLQLLSRIEENTRHLSKARIDTGSDRSAAHDAAHDAATDEAALVEAQIAEAEEDDPDDGEAMLR